MKALLDLAERCEKATGPDYALDHEIRVAVNPEDWAAKVARFKAGVLGPRTSDADIPGYLPAQPFTASIDAALTLVPEGRHWTIEPDSAWVRWMGKADVEEAQGHLSGRGGKCTALALTAAALRAIAQTQPDNSNE